MKTLTRLFAIIALAFAPIAFAQQNQSNQQEVVVHIKQDGPPQPAADKTVVEKANEWVEFGKHVGGAMDAGLTSLSKNANQFAATPAGKFTMAVIAWKVAGNDAMAFVDHVKRIFIGIPFLIAWTILFIWFYRKNFVEYSVLKTKTGPFWNRVKTYETVNVDSNWGEGKAAAAVISGLIYAGFTVGIAIAIIF